MMISFCILSTLFVYGTLAEVTILVGQPQTIYDRSPKLRIKGSGFDAEDHDIKLEIGATGSTLKPDKDYSITKDEQGEGIILKLMANRRYLVGNIYKLHP